MGPLSIGDGWLKDEHGRRLLLRGVNLGGSSKVPFRPDGATYRREGFFNHRSVSFVGRPFPLGEADEHFARLRAWGFTFLRFLVTWEAVEHAGPGIYDEDYLEYLHAIVMKAGKHALSLFIDPHQDCWSRFCGGDGAPGWTHEAVGLDIRHFDETGAAITHQAHGDPFPAMIWPTNYSKLAAATMFTLFFAGDHFAPRTQVDGEPVQEYLQRHYIAAMRRVAQELRDLPNVVGFDSLNEPSSGYIGCDDLRAPIGEPRIGETPSPYQAMLLGAGLPQKVEVWKFTTFGPKKVGVRVLDPMGKRAWLSGHDCIWRQHGVWDFSPAGEPQLLRPDYFRFAGGSPVDFHGRYFRPFIHRFATAIHSTSPHALVFAEPCRGHPLPVWGPQDPPVVYSPHWYDGLVLMLKDFTPWLGVDASAHRFVWSPWVIRRSYARQIRDFKRGAQEHFRGAPILVGEVGVPFNLRHKSAYRKGDFSLTVRAMDRSLRAMDDGLVSYTLWNYTADNSNARGDQWNDEDLSIFSRDQQQDPSDLDSGGRALAAVVRPYAMATAGEPLRMSFNLRTRTFEFEFLHNPAVRAPTEFFLPRLQYPGGCRVKVTDGRFEIDRGAQRLLYWHTQDRARHQVRVRPI